MDHIYISLEEGARGVHSSSFSRDFSNDLRFSEQGVSILQYEELKIPKIRVSRREFFSLQTINSKTRCPTRYPISFNLHINSVKDVGTVVLIQLFLRLYFEHM